MRCLRINRSKSIINFHSRTVELLYGIGLFIYISTLILDMTVLTISDASYMNEISLMMKLLRYTGYAIMAFKIFYSTDVEYRRIIMILIVAAIVGVSFITSHNTTVIFYFIIVLAAKGVSDRIIIKSAFLAQGIVLFLIVFLSRIGLITDYVTHNDYRTRHFLGFRWATTPALIFLFIVFEYIYLVRGKLKIFEFFGIGGIAYYLYYMTDSRMAFFICILTAGFFCILGERISHNEGPKWFKYAMVTAPWIIASCAIYIQKIFVDQGFLGKLDVFLSRRLRFGHAAIKNYGISLVGKKVKWVGHGLNDSGGSEYNYVDCSYLKIAIEYGILFLIIILAIYSFIILRAYRSGQYYLTWLILLVLVLSITESRLLDFAFNPFTILTMSLVTDKGEQSDTAQQERYE